MSGEHAVLPCSSAKEWSNCDGWLAMNEAVPEPPESDEAIWGTQCHAVASEWLERCSRGDTSAPDIADKEMLETADLYVKHCLGLMRTAGAYGGKALGLEARLHMLSVSAHVWGTADFYAWDAHKKTLYVRDLKTGRLLVEPDDPQLLLYAIGALEELGLRGERYIVDLGVVQPRGYHRKGPIRTIRLDSVDLQTAVAARLRERAEANLSRTGKTQAGQHCHQCKASTRCPAAIEAAQSLPYAVAEAIPAQLQPADVGLLLKQTKRAIKFLEQMEKAYEGEAEGLLRSGQVVPGWSMEDSYARSKDWTVADEQVLMLGELYGVDLRKPGLRTPTQAQNDGIPEEVINGYCTRRKTGVKLTESNDTTIANIFNGVK